MEINDDYKKKLL